MHRLPQCHLENRRVECQNIYQVNQYDTPLLPRVLSGIYPAVWPGWRYDPAGTWCFIGNPADVKSDHKPAYDKPDGKSDGNPVDVKSDHKPADDKPDGKSNGNPADVKLDHKPADDKPDGLSDGKPADSHNPADRVAWG